MLSKLMGLLIISPLIVIVIVSFNPPERALISEDENNKNTVNALSRAALLYKTKYGSFPNDPNDLKAREIIDLLPENPENYIFKNDGIDLIVYSKAQSLSWREYCSGETTNIVFSSKDSRTDFVCGDSLLPGEQKFVN